MKLFPGLWKESRCIARIPFATRNSVNKFIVYDLCVLLFSLSCSTSSVLLSTQSFDRTRSPFAHASTPHSRFEGEFKEKASKIHLMYTVQTIALYGELESRGLRYLDLDYSKFFLTVKTNQITEWAKREIFVNLPIVVEVQSHDENSFVIFHIWRCTWRCVLESVSLPSPPLAWD